MRAVLIVGWSRDGKLLGAGTTRRYVPGDTFSQVEVEVGDPPSPPIEEPVKPEEPGVDARRVIEGLRADLVRAQANLATCRRQNEDLLRQLADLRARLDGRGASPQAPEGPGPEVGA